MNNVNQCGATAGPLTNIPEQEQIIGGAITELSDSVARLESRLSSVTVNIPRPCEKDPNVKQPEPQMSDLAMALKGRAQDIVSVTYRINDIIQTLEV